MQQTTEIPTLSEMMAQLYPSPTDELSANELNAATLTADTLSEIDPYKMARLHRKIITAQLVRDTLLLEPIWDAISTEHRLKKAALQLNGSDDYSWFNEVIADLTEAADRQLGPAGSAFARERRTLAATLIAARSLGPRVRGGCPQCGWTETYVDGESQEVKGSNFNNDQHDCETLNLIWQTPQELDKLLHLIPTLWKLGKSHGWQTGSCKECDHETAILGFITPDQAAGPLIKASPVHPGSGEPAGGTA